jgi:hypothetical protein
MEGVEESFAHPKALHFGGDAQPDWAGSWKREKEKGKDVSIVDMDYSLFVFNGF